MAVSVCTGEPELCCYFCSFSLDEPEHVGIDLLGMSCRHSVREARIDLKSRALHELRGLQRCGADRHDLVVVSVKNEGWDVELLQIFCEVRLGERLDAVIPRFH